jgi:hypothetical protein
MSPLRKIAVLKQRLYVKQTQLFLRIFAFWGHCLFWAVFWKITKVAHIVGLIISTVKVVYQFFNGLGYILGDFFQKRIWSP